MDVKKLLKLTIDRKASDLHLVVGRPPTLRIDGRLVETDAPVLTEEAVKPLVFGLMSPTQKDQFLVNKELDFSSELSGEGRFRVNT